MNKKAIVEISLNLNTNYASSQNVIELVISLIFKMRDEYDIFF